MNILMMTNTYKPILGGLEKSVESFAQEFRKRGHRVIIVAPAIDGMVEEEDVLRIPAAQHFNHSDFSVQLPIPNGLETMLNDFAPHIVHSQHPFLIGDTALRVASKFNVPLVFTHHTLYEENVHYVPGNEEALKRFVIELSTGYANLADQVFAPSESVMKLMRERGVESPVDVVPTGIDVNKFLTGDRKEFRAQFNIPENAFVVGHIGRLAIEKNLEFVTKAAAQFLIKYPDAFFLIGGTGPSQELLTEMLNEAGLAKQYCFTGNLKGKELVNAYHAMDVFIFASKSETQGLVVAEAMACGIPVVALDAPGIREVVTDRLNGCLLMAEKSEDFVQALEWVKQRSPEESAALKLACQQTAERFSRENSVAKAFKIYVALTTRAGFLRRPISEDSFWSKSVRMIQTQWGLVKNFTNAAGAMIEHQEAS